MLSDELETRYKEVVIPINEEILTEIRIRTKYEHLRLAEFIEGLGRSLGFTVKREFEDGNVRIDVVWMKRRRVKAVFEIVTRPYKYMLTNAINNLIYAHKKWKCNLFLVTPKIIDLYSSIKRKVIFILKNQYPELIKHIRIISELNLKNRLRTLR